MLLEFNSENCEISPMDGFMPYCIYTVSWRMNQAVMLLVGSLAKI